MRQSIEALKVKIDNHLKRENEIIQEINDAGLTQNEAKELIDLYLDMKDLISLRLLRTAKMRS